MRGWEPVRILRSAARSPGEVRPALEELVGFFVNTLVLRTDVSGDPSFRELVRECGRLTCEAYDHQDVPFERVVEALQPARSLARHPLFQVMLVLQNAPAADLALPGLKGRPEPLTRDVAKFDLTLSWASIAARVVSRSGSTEGWNTATTCSSGNRRRPWRRGWCDCSRRRSPGLTCRSTGWRS